MRFLVVYAHPMADSYQAALHRRVVTTLGDLGHDVDDCDLYAEGFQPALSEIERRRYYDPRENRAFVEKEVDRLLRCEGLVLVFPTWWYGMPAILKGYFDRVWLPGVAFEVAHGQLRPLLRNITRFAVVTTYGSPWWLNKIVLGDPNRRVLMRGIRTALSPRVKTHWLAQYDMDHLSQARRERFLARVSAAMRTL